MSHFTLRTGDRVKAEQELMTSIRKATSIEENAPKRKHVRNLIVFTWDYKTSVPIWEYMKSQPLRADEVQCYKALITLHKVVREGHQVSIPEALSQTTFLEELGRGMGGGSYAGWRNYSVLIRAYVNFLLAKLEYHRLHPDFRGDFDYEEYVSLRGTNDPNEGYETIADLMSLQDRLDEFQKLVFRSFQPASNNECRIASLVPLVEESYGIYKFATRMLIAMHQRVDGAEEALEPLRTRYNAHHYALRKFYYECSNLRYLTSLIVVPRLPQHPPNLFGEDYSPPNLPDSPPSVSDRNMSTPALPEAPPPPSPTIDLEAERRAGEELRQRQEEEERQRQFLLQQQIEQQRIEQQTRYEEQQRLQRQREQEQLAQLQREQLQRQVQGKMQEMEQQLLLMRGQHERDQMTIDQYNKRVAALEEQIRQLQLLQMQQDAGKDELIRQLQAQIEQWKQKYEALAKLYAQLRQKHLELLPKYMQLELKANSAAEVMQKMDKMQGEMRRKNLELADMMRERDKAQADLQRLENGQQEELERLRRALEDSEDRVRDLNRNKSAEAQDMLRKFNADKEGLQRQLDAMLADFDRARKRYDDLRGEHNQLRQAKDDEIAVLQAGMDHSIVAMANLKKQVGGNQSDLQRRLDSSHLEYAQKLKRILDSILRSCADKTDEAVFNLNDPSNPGNMTATVEHVLATIEQVHEAGNSLAASFAGYLANPDGDQTQVISTAIGLSNGLEHLLANLKGVSRLANGEDLVERIVKASRSTALIGRQFFVKGQSAAMDKLLVLERPGVILDTNRDLQQSLAMLTALTEGLVPQDANKVSVANTNEDVSDLVEREMLNAARAIDEAVRRLQALANQPRDSSLTDHQVQVHDAILDSSMAMTNAIAQLIRAATASQQEIVAQGRGSSTKAAFYKKNNRWTDGLISAAKAVAVATNNLVETADGVIKGTRSLEHLVVAAREVSAATVQLVAASRVKSQLYSKTQERLELAAKAVTEASAHLVRATQRLSEKEEESRQAEDFDKMSNLEFKSKEMDQQVMILKLEKDLVGARRRLAEMRRHGYHAEEEDGSF
ncbi:sla2 Src-like adaptor 2 [Coemansia sp. RSA 376]|nr:sla2 Src-like adaptor 2 [Coemansia sp. S680]KAJ2030102.1 sla2 Src-like adaptor 2 [Coemansia sp. S3946]KAJ2110248.1 sla2 Src-like adaptor 2 [Coemansia sp. RSA 922]KAJ2263464.1 sla2 Src-like adaptor 2 [Coemansia sp. RSA 376]